MRNRRVVLASAAGVVVLLAAFLIVWLTRGSDGVADAAADRTTATTTSESTSASASSTSSSPAASTPHSGSTTPTTTAAPTTTSTPAAPPAATTPAPRPTPAQTAWPAESTPRYGQELWAVYLIAAVDYTDAEQARMDGIYRDLQSVGYTGLNGALCDDGADRVGVDPYGNAVAVYFASQAAAQQFLAAWDGPSVGSTKITVICGD